MPVVTLNGVSFAAGVALALDATARRAPKKVTPKPRRIGPTFEAIDGTPNHFDYGEKVDQELVWEKVNELTRAGVRAVFNLGTTFSGTVPEGSGTFYCREEDYSEEEAFCMPDGVTRFYDVTLLIRQAT